MMMSKRKALLLFFIFTLFSFCVYPTTAADTYPEYIIREGDYLSIVAELFSTTVDEILAINSIANVNAISIGTKIKIPSLPGLSGVIKSENANVGDTMRTLSILNSISEKDLAVINRIASPTEIYIGSGISILEKNEAKLISAADSILEGDTLFEKSVQTGQNPLSMVLLNQFQGLWDYTPKDIIFAKAEQKEGAAATVHSISPVVDVLKFGRLPLIQGETHVLQIQSKHDLSLSGTIGEQNLRFFRDQNAPENWYALIGIDAMAETGLSSFAIRGVAETGEQFAISQPIIVKEGKFTQEVVEGVDPSTLEGSNINQDAQVIKSITQTSAEKRWNGSFIYPVDSPCFASGFGNRRTYNDGAFSNYHTGADFSVCAADNINIYAAADGEVLFAQELPIHGNYTILDHGWGVYSSYSHQSEIKVVVGQQVKKGELIGLIGSTGRSVGPHLHWEVLINSIYVNPMTWINAVFP